MLVRMKSTLHPEPKAKVWLPDCRTSAMRTKDILRPNIHDLHHCIHHGKTEDVKEILDKNTVTNINTTVCGATALSLTLYKEKYVLFNMLLDHENIKQQMNLDKLSKDEKQRYEPPLVSACRLGNRDAVKMLVEHGADLEAKDNLQHTAVWMATCERYTDIVQYLIACGCSVNPSKVWTNSPLFFAVRCSSKRTEIAKMLIYHGAEVNVIKGSSLLYCAIIQGDLEIAKLIVDAGYSVSLDEKVRSEFGSGILSRNSRLLTWLEEELRHPASLQRQCRSLIRRLVSCRINGIFFLDSIPTLPLPKSIIHYLALVHNIEDIRCKKKLSCLPCVAK